MKNPTHIQVKGQVWEQVYWQSRNQIKHQINSEVWNQVYSSIRDKANLIKFQIEFEIKIPSALNEQ